MNWIYLAEWMSNSLTLIVTMKRILKGESRQITQGESSQFLEVAVTLTAKEADEIATRKLYRDYVEGDTHDFTLSWKYLYLYPGYIISTTKNGVNISLQLTEIKGGISILECQGVSVETSLTDQNASTSGGDGFERPPVPIPGHDHRGPDGYGASARQRPHCE
jgi:hypothetical protein